MFHLMRILDSKLKYLRFKARLSEEPFHVLLRFRNDISALESLGFRLTSRAEDVAAGFIENQQLEQLLTHPDLISAEFAPPLKDEMEMSLAAINLIHPVTHHRTIPSLGDGAIIGVIDSGFDLTHPCFFNASGETRILAAWDQSSSGEVKGTPPEEFDYGDEHTPEMIAKYIEKKKTVVIKNAPRKGGHGTTVACIAAGNGLPDGSRAGVAPEAKLILVAYRNDVPVGGSSFVLDAIHYILLRAHPHPVVINISQGDSLGAHDGTSLLERAIDNIIEEKGVAVVCSAGNERGGMRHAQGLVRPGRDFSLYFDLSLDEKHQVDGDTIEIWYQRGDSFEIALTPPGGSQSKFIQPATAEMVTFPEGNQAFICSETDHPDNGDNRIGIILEKGAGWKSSRWKVTLRSNVINHGGFHAWADRPNRVTVISFPHASDNCTVTLPGNSRRIITVSGFVSRPAVGESEGNIQDDLQPLSSLGPTRDGRIKPDLTAPGFIIMAPSVHKDDGDDPLNYQPHVGTSMSAPHVTGIIALLLSLNPDLSVEQIRATLYSTATGNRFTGLLPNISWGQGSVNAGAAYQALSSPVKMEE